LHTVTPDAKAKTHFILVDAVGVTQSPKSSSSPLNREASVPFEKLLDKVARGNRTDATLSTLAARLLRLDALLDEKDRARVTAACGLSLAQLAQLAQPLGVAADPDTQAALARMKFSLPVDAEPTVEQLREAAAAPKEAAARPFSSPALRHLIVELQQRAEITVDHLSPDHVVEGTGYDTEKARSYIAEFERFIRENRDRILALQILYGRRHSRRRLTYTLIRDLAAAMESDSAHLAPAEVWKCYARLQPERARVLDPGSALTNLISLVRFATGQQQELTPFPELARVRFETWLDRKRKRVRLLTAF
jgi:type I restriction enzyme R subunit